MRICERVGYLVAINRPVQSVASVLLIVMPRILVVEDESIVAEEIQDRLTRLGFDVVGVVDTGAAAVAWASRTRPDLVLMDIHLKGSLDGIDAADQIYRQQGTPVVYLTAYWDRATLDRARTIAQFGYVVKPAGARSAGGDRDGDPSLGSGAAAQREPAQLRDDPRRARQTRSWRQTTRVECGS